MKRFVVWGQVPVLLAFSLALASVPLPMLSWQVVVLIVCAVAYGTLNFLDGFRKGLEIRTGGLS